MNLVLYIFFLILTVGSVSAKERRFNISEGQSAEEIDLSYHRFIANSELGADQRDQFIGDSISMWEHYGITWDDQGNAEFTSEMLERFKEVIDKRTVLDLVKLSKYCRLVNKKRYFEQHGLEGPELPNPPVFYLKPKDVPAEKKTGRMDLGNLNQFKEVVEKEAKPSSSGSDLTFDLGNAVSLKTMWIEALNGWVGQYEVTNAQYRSYDASHSSGKTTFEDYCGYTLDEDTQPVVKISYYEAIEYTNWLNKVNKDRLPEGYHFRLPKNNEWFIYSKCEDGRGFPWGNDWPPIVGNYYDSGNYPDAEARGGDWTSIKGYSDNFKVTAPVAESGRNEFGLYGISGNVQEYTSEVIDDRVLLRGGNWGSDRRDGLRCEYSYPLRLDQSGITVGFRVVLMPENR